MLLLYHGDGKNNKILIKGKLSLSMKRQCSSTLSSSFQYAETLCYFPLLLFHEPLFLQPAIYYIGTRSLYFICSPSYFKAEVAASAINPPYRLVWFVFSKKYIFFSHKPLKSQSSSATFLSLRTLSSGRHVCLLLKNAPSAILTSLILHYNLCDIIYLI